MKCELQHITASHHPTPWALCPSLQLLMSLAPTVAWPAARPQSSMRETPFVETSHPPAALPACQPDQLWPCLMHHPLSLRMSSPREATPMPLSGDAHTVPHGCSPPHATWAPGTQNHQGRRKPLSDAQRRQQRAAFCG